MKVDIAVTGRFHAFDLARELNKRNILGKLITTYPKFKAKEWDIDSDKIISEAYLEVLNRLRLKLPVSTQMPIGELIKKIHDRKVAKCTGDNEVLIGWSGSSLNSIIKAKRNNKIVILERGSSHYSYYLKNFLLNQKYQRFDIGYQVNYSQWQRELLEYELADFISIPSSFVKKTFTDNGIQENKLIVNPYGVDISKFKQLPKKDDVFRILNVGQGSFRKGFHHLLQAFFELDLPNSELIHIGTVMPEMKSFLAKYNHPNIILIGNKPQNELKDYYSNASIFVLPTIDDGFAMVLSEAMACGLPVISTTNSGCPDLISKDGKEGFIIPIESVESIKEKIEYLYRNQDKCLQMGVNAKKRILSNFTWDDYGDRYFKFLTNIGNSAVE